LTISILSFDLDIKCNKNYLYIRIHWIQLTHNVLTLVGLFIPTSWLSSMIINVCFSFLFFLVNVYSPMTTHAPIFSTARKKVISLGNEWKPVLLLFYLDEQEYDIKKGKKMCSYRKLFTIFILVFIHFNLFGIRK
jgi:hypothetical protein